MARNKKSLQDRLKQLFDAVTGGNSPVRVLVLKQGSSVIYVHDDHGPVTVEAYYRQENNAETQQPAERITNSDGR